jgi:sodium/proline symporter
VTRADTILLTIVAYKLAMLAIGGWAARRTRDAADFFVGGRRLGGFVASLSASASSSSAWTLIGVCGYAYANGLSAVWIFPGCVLGFWINWAIIAPVIRQLAADEDAVTLTDLLAGPRGAPGRRAIVRVASTLVLLALLTYVASQFSGAAKTFVRTFAEYGASYEGSVLIGAAIVTAYTLLGGFWAVSVTDTLQGVLMLLAAVVLPIAALTEVGGPSGMLEGLGSVPVEGYASLTAGAEPAVAVGTIAGLLGISLGYPGQPHVVNRLMALRDPEAVIQGRRVAVAWATIVYAGMIVAGLCARLVLDAGALADHENAFVALTNALFSPVVAGVLIAAVLSAIMSTADSQLLVAASAVSYDLSTGDGHHETLRRARVVVLAAAALAVGLALTLTKEIFSSVLFAWSALGAAFGPLVWVLVWRGRPRWRFVLGAMIAGFGLSVVAYALPATRGGAWERVAPWVVAWAIARAGAPRSRRASPQR